MRKAEMKSITFCAALLAFMGVSSSAMADVVVVVSAKSTVTALTPEQTAQLFLGKTSSLPGGEIAVPIDLTPGNPVRDEFYSKVAKKSSAQMSAYRANFVFSGKGKPPREVPGNAEVKKLLSENANAIGYIEKSAVDGSVKVVLNP